MVNLLDSKDSFILSVLINEELDGLVLHYVEEEKELYHLEHPWETEDDSPKYAFVNCFNVFWIW